MSSNEVIGRGVVEARLDTSRLASDTRRAGQQIQQSLQRTGRQLRQTGATMSRRLTMPVVAAGAAIVKVATDFESSMKQLEAVTGATGDELNALQDQAKELGRTTQFSASQAAEGMYFLASAGFETNEVIGAMPGVLQLAAAANMDLARATDIASNILSGYGMEAEELGRVNDVLVATFQATNTNVEQLGEAMKYVGPVAKGAGVDFEQVAAAAGLLGNAGIQASQAGTSLRGAISRLLNPSSAAASVLDELGIQAVNADGSLRPLDEIVQQLADSGATTGDMMEIFGQRAGPAMAALVEQGADALTDLTGELKESGGIAETVADKQMEGMRGALLRLKSAAEGAAIAIADTGLLEGLTNFAEGAASAFQALAEANPQLVKFGAIAAAGVAAAGPIMWAVGAAISALGVVLSPAGLVIGGLVALGGLLIDTAGEGDTFAEKFIDAVDKVKRFIGPAVDAIGDAISDVAEWFGVTRQTVGEEVAEMSSEATGEVVDMAQEITDGMRQLERDAGEVSSDMADTWIGNVERMRDEAVAAANENYEETLQEASNLARDLESVSGQMAMDWVRQTEEQRDQTVATVEEQADQMISRFEWLRDEGGEVTEEMRAWVVDNMENLRDDSIRAIEGYTQDTEVLIAGLSARSGQISKEMASNIISDSARQRDETIAATNEEHDGRVEAILRMRDEVPGYTQAMADEAIEDSERQRSESVRKAKEQHNEVVGEMIGLREGVTEEIDTATGRMLSSWDIFYEENLAGFINWADKTGSTINQWARDAGDTVNQWAADNLAGTSQWIEDSVAQLYRWNRDAGNAIVDFTTRIPGMFSSMWQGIQRNAASGVNGLIGLLNGMIRGVNRVSSAVGLGDLASEIGEVSWGSSGGWGRPGGGNYSPGRMHDGGLVTASSGRPGDAQLRPDEHVKILQSGEEVITTEDPRHRLNRRSENDEIGNPFERVGSAISGMARSAMSKARETVAGVLDAGIPKVPDMSQYGMVGTLGSGLGNQARDGVVDWIRGVDDELATSDLGPGVGWQAMWDALSAEFPWARLTSDYRPGAITATGNPSMHGMGRAIDVAGRGYMNHDDMLEIARWVAAEHGAQTAELIYSRGPSLIDGNPWMPTGITRANHFDHVHWAMKNGGVVDQPTLGMLGEYPDVRSNPEIVAPQKLMRQTMDQALVGAGGGHGGDVHVHGSLIHERELDRLLDRHEARRDRRRAGS